MTDYGMTVRLSEPCDRAIEIVTDALKDEGFGVLTRIDVDKTLKAKLDIDKDPYVILGACNPQLANRALEVEPQVGLLLPCNVIVYEMADHEGSVVSIIDPAQAMAVSGNAALEPIAAEAAGLLRAVAQRLAELA